MGEICAHFILFVNCEVPMPGLSTWKCSPKIDMCMFVYFCILWCAFEHYHATHHNTRGGNPVIRLSGSPVVDFSQQRLTAGQVDHTRPVAVSECQLSTR